MVPYVLKLRPVGLISRRFIINITCIEDPFSMFCNIDLKMLLSSGKLISPVLEAQIFANSTSRPKKIRFPSMLTLSDSTTTNKHCKLQLSASSFSREMETTYIFT